MWWRRLFVFAAFACSILAFVVAWHGGLVLVLIMLGLAVTFTAFAMI